MAFTTGQSRLLASGLLHACLTRTLSALSRGASWTSPLPALASPIVAGTIALCATFLAYRLTQRARQDTVADGFRHGQTISASLVSLAHGTGDAQKTMGVIPLVLISAGHRTAGSRPPVWVILASAHLGFALSTT